MWKCLMLLMVSTAAMAVDYTCLSDCADTGKSADECSRVCDVQQSYPEWPSNSQPKREPVLDETCMQECTEAKQPYQYCKDRCTS